MPPCIDLHLARLSLLPSCLSILQSVAACRSVIMVSRVIERVCTSCVSYLTIIDTFTVWIIVRIGHRSSHKRSQFSILPRSGRRIAHDRSNAKTDREALLVMMMQYCSRPHRVCSSSHETSTTHYYYYSLRKAFYHFNAAC